MHQKHLVIVGGGFAGVVLAKRLADDHRYKITLINTTRYHSFQSNLYEVATSPEEVTYVEQLKKTVSMPLAEIFKGTNIAIVVANVDSVDFEKQQVVTKKETIAYDELVLATGSVSEYYGVPGAEEFGLTLKSVADALKLRSQTETVISKAAFEVTKNSLRFVIAGGGYTGVEYAAELSGFLDFLSWKYAYPREKLEIVILESGPEFFRGAMSRASKDSYARLKQKGVRVQLFSTVKEVQKSQVLLASGEVMQFDMLIWTAGVSGCAIISKQTLDLSKQHRIEVNEHLQAVSIKNKNVYALGDAACVKDNQGSPAPTTAQDAVDQAIYLSKFLTGKTQEKYNVLSHGYIVMLGGRWAIFCQGNWYITGWLGWFIGQAAHFRYYYRVVGFWKALSYIFLQMDVYSRND